MADPYSARNQYEEGEEEAKLLAKLNYQLNDHVQNYPIDIPFPANVSSASPRGGGPPKNLRTDFDFIQHRLLDHGLMFGEFQSIGQVTESLSGFVADLEQSGCYDTVRVSLGTGVEHGQDAKDQKQPDGQVSFMFGCFGSFVAKHLGLSTYPV